MPVDLSNGLNLRVEGEIGKYKTLPIEYLIKLSENLQKLIQDIARFQLEADGAIDLSNFKIELAGFKAGSAIPEFVFTPRVKTVTSGDVIEQRKFISKQFSQYLSVAHKGDYTAIKNIIPQAKIRNIIVEDLYDLASTFGNSPVSVVNIKGRKITPVYKINKFKTEIKDRLITKITDSEETSLEFEGVAKVKIIKKGSRVTYTRKDTFEAKHAEPSYSTDTIVFGNRAYILAFPLRCKLEKEDNYYVIESEMLEIVGTGKTIDEAEANFNEEFHFIYIRYNQLSDKNLSLRVKRIKTILNSIVTKIED
jgi:hypothetical protein